MAFCRTEDSLRNYAVSALSCLLLLSIVLSLAGCIAHAPGNGGGGGKQIAVAVASSPASPASVSVSTSTPSTVQYTATVTGTSNQAVTWSLAADPDATTVCTASGSALGTIATTGTNTMTYTAPAGPLPMSPCGVAVTATSNEDNVTTGQALGLAGESRSPTVPSAKAPIYNLRRPSSALPARIRTWIGARPVASAPANKPQASSTRKILDCTSRRESNLGLTVSKRP